MCCVGHWQTGQCAKTCTEMRRNVNWAAVSSRDHVSRCSGGQQGAKTTRGPYASHSAKELIHTKHPALQYTSAREALGTMERLHQKWVRTKTLPRCRIKA